MSRGAWVVLGVAIAGIVAIVVVMANGGNDTTTTAGASSTTTTGAESTTSPPPDGPTVRLVTSSGLDEELVVSSCENPDESSLVLSAESTDLEDPLLLELDAQGGTGSITLSGATEAEGTVDEVMVGDTGGITASGALAAADDSSAQQATFELTGNCA